MPISIQSIADAFNANVNPWRAAIEQPEVPHYSICYDGRTDCLYLMNGVRCTLLAERKEIDDHGHDTIFFQQKAQSIMKEWEDLK